MVVAASFGISNTGCSDDPVAPKPVDTTDTTGGGEDPIVNGFKIGFDQYDLTTEESKTYGVHNKAANRTYVYVAGNDGKNGDADFDFEFPGNMAGTFTNQAGGSVMFSCGTGTVGDIKREEFASDAALFTVVVTEYGAVGEMIKGTFSGKVKKGTNTFDVSKGYFEVERLADE